MCNCAVNWCDKLCFLHLYFFFSPAVSKQNIPVDVCRTVKVMKKNKVAPFYLGHGVVISDCY